MSAECVRAARWSWGWCLSARQPFFFARRALTSRTTMFSRAVPTRADAGTVPACAVLTGTANVPRTAAVTVSDARGRRMGDLQVRRTSDGPAFRRGPW